MRQVFSTQSFKLRGDVTLSNCSDTHVDSLDLQWSIISTLPAAVSVPTLDPQTENTRTLYVPPQVLLPGTNYTFLLEVSVFSSEGGTGVATVEVVCVFGPLVASIDGGSRTTSAQESLVLDASKSYDLDGSMIASTYPFVFSWACINDQGGLCFVDTEGVLLQSSSMLFLKAGTLLPGAYLFSVNATKEPGPRVSTTAVWVWVYPGLVPAVGIDPLSFPVVNPGVRLVLSGQVPASGSGNYAMLWSQTEGDDLMQYPKYVSTPLNLPSLAIQTNVLTAGQAYSFRFTVIDGKSGLVGFAEIRFTVNSPPTSGSFSVSPTIGYGLIDTFTLLCVNWADEAEDLPISYEFRYIENATQSTAELPLGSPDTNSYSVTLPVPPPPQQQLTLTLVAYITDQWGGQQRAVQAATVRAVPTSKMRRTNSSAYNDGLQELDSCEATGNIDCVVRLATQLARSLAGSITCTDRASMIETLQISADQYHVNKAELAAFAESIRAVSAMACIDDSAGGGIRRAGSSGDVAVALGLAQTLTNASLDAGLDPVATNGIGGSLSSALATIAQKNSARRALRSLLSLGGSHQSFARRGSNLQTAEANARVQRRAQDDLASTLMGALAGLSQSQLSGAVTGEDAAGLATGLIRMNSQRVLPNALEGAQLAPPASNGQPGPAFSLPQYNFSGSSSSLAVRVTGKHSFVAFMKCLFREAF